VLGQKFPDTQGRIVVVQEPGTGRPFVRPFLTNCISKALQNGYVDSLIHGLTLGKKLVSYMVVTSMLLVVSLLKFCSEYFLSDLVPSRLLFPNNSNILINTITIANS
jgi:hypothetical protein